ncbi:NYN domain-containing protein [Vibrio genomosp. F10]|uniref:Nuclease n=1 Tax=Vibrio genomosp. F10 str. ZF-129 TaxID=1187848 RepID=A0A1E5BBQ1_9VIBR|nr:NYN domain-containing protein [Vibrio genomosp. F10]OEE31675.1 nuclease [Vibrio genomosp. F10 str. ZF-129]OEE91773.1 nuclease [Vibrio genomosp. F10 str. 9ZD137]
MENIAVLVDVQNVYYTTRDKYRRNFDYNQFWHVATAGCHVAQANAYAISSKDPKQRQFHHILRGIGFNVCLKPFIQRKDGSAKGDWDVGIALDAFELASTVDRVILVSGDGDFSMLVDRIKSRFSKPVEVYGVPGLTSQDLIESASKFIPIDDDLLL